MPAQLARESGLGRLVAQHSLGWLVAANGVGLWLASLLVWPELGQLAGPLTYGRWVPLHLDWQLYGWCALPLAGALLAWYVDPAHPAMLPHARLALAAWSLALVVGGLAWLDGVSSGKLFLEWHAWSRPALPLALLALWTVLGAHLWWRRHTLPRAGLLFGLGLLLALLPVPSLLYWAAGREVYPSVNPDSGGATGAALLGSTLGIITVFGLIPRFLGLKRRGTTRWFWPALATAWLVFALLDHGNASHHARDQIAGLTLLILWMPALVLYWRAWQWHGASRPWLAAALVWWVLLVANGWLSFLPGFSERLKFTDGLVGHSHLAMAGLVTGTGGVVLAELTGRPVTRWAFWLWQIGCAVQVLALLGLGWDEAANPAAHYLGDRLPHALLLLRLLAGTAMTAASVRWLIDFTRP